MIDEFSFYFGFLLFPLGMLLLYAAMYIVVFLLEYDEFKRWKAKQKELKKEEE